MNTRIPLADRRVGTSHREWVTATKAPLVAVERTSATFGDMPSAPIDDIRRQTASKSPSLNGLNGQMGDTGGDD